MHNCAIIHPLHLELETAQENVLRNRSCAGGDDEGVRNGDINGPVLNSSDYGGECVHQRIDVSRASPISKRVEDSWRGCLWRI